MKQYDSTLPEILKKNQIWFASIITRPIDDCSRMMPISPSGIPMEVEASEFIVPSPTLKPHQRIELYNQQYWWRFLTNLQENYPLVTRLFGYYDFNQTIAIPYLVKYPPNHWSLNCLGERLPEWVEEDYHAEDKSAIWNAASIDRAFHNAFVAPEYTPLDLSQFSIHKDLSSILDDKLYLQPHIYLFEMPYDLFSFREKMVAQDGDYWIDHPFPELSRDKTYYHILYRNQRKRIAWEPISAGEFYLLSLFISGCTINEACELLEKQEKSIYNEALSNLSDWFSKWAARRWLSFSENPVEPMPGFFGS